MSLSWSGVRVFRRSLLAVLMVSGLLVAVDADAADAKKPKVGVSFGVTGLQVKVTGSVSKGSVKGALPRRRWKANLEQQVGKRWVVRRSVRVTGPKKGPSKFRLSWKAPKALNAKFRVRVTSGKKTVGNSKVKLLSFTAGGSGFPEVKAVESTTVQKLPTENDKTLILNGTHTYKPGEFIAAAPGEGAPNGFLLKVVSSTTSDGKTTVKVVPGDLFEAVPEGQLNLAAGTLDMAIPLNADARRLTRAMNRSASSYAGVPFDKQVTCTGSGSMELDGNLDASLGPNFDLEWKKTLGVAHGIKKASATVDAFLGADASAEVTAAASCEMAPVTLLAPQFLFVVPVGPVAVPVKVSVPIVLDAEASVSGSVKISASASISGSLGIKYEDDNLHPVKEISTDSSLEHEAEAQASAEASIGPELAITAGWDFPVIGGVAAEAEVDLKTGLKLTYDTATNPPGKLCVPFTIEGNFKLNTPIKDFNLGLPSYSTDIKCAEFGDNLPIHDKWRGWVAVQESYLPSWFGGGDSQHVSRSVFADTSREDRVGVARADVYYRFQVPNPESSCQKSEFAGSSTLPAELSPVLNVNSEVLGHGLPVPTEMYGWHVSATGSISMPGIQRSCGSPDPISSTGYSEGAAGFSNVGFAWPASVFETPPASVQRSYEMIVNEHYHWEFAICMSRSTVDSDGDGFPDEVDLAPDQAASAANLGHPAGASTWDVPIPNHFGGPDGVEGLPTCPLV